MKPPKLKRVTRLDSIRLDETYFTQEGYFVDTPIVTSVGIFEYANPDGTVRRELRLPEHVFEPESLASYETKPVIVTHDANWVTERNAREEQIGTILSKGIKDGSDVRAKIVIHAIREVEKSGLRELSLGYRLDLDETPGTWNGQKYDAVQKNIRINHLALVKDARAGEKARLNLDGKGAGPLKGGKPGMAKKRTKPSAGQLAKRLDARMARRRRDEDEYEILIIPKDEDRGDIDIPGGEDDAYEYVAEALAEADKKLQEVLGKRKDRDEKGAPETLEEALEYIIQMDDEYDELLEIIEKQKAEADYLKAKEKDDEDDYEDYDEDEEEAEAYDEDEEPYDEKPAKKKNKKKGDADHGDYDKEAKPKQAENIEIYINADGRQTKGRVPAASVERIVRERLRLLRIGDRLNLDGLEGMAPRQMKAAIIKAVNPKMRLDGRRPEYVDAAFDIAVAGMGAERSTDRQRRSMGRRADGAGHRQGGGSMADSARDRMNERLMNGGGE